VDNLSVYENGDIFAASFPQEYKSQVGGELEGSV
jgi:hypothetical protein